MQINPSILDANEIVIDSFVNTGDRGYGYAEAYKR